MNRILIVLLVAVSTPVAAEHDGNELLAFTQRPASHDAAAAFIDDIRTRRDGTLFCISGKDRRTRAFNAVRL